MQARLERREPPLAADEKAMLSSWLDFHRATVLIKTAELAEDELRRPMVASGTSLLGIVKHLGHVERWWFRMVFDGQDLPKAWSDEDPNGDWRIDSDETAEDVVAFYLDEITAARAIISAGDLDERSRRPDRSEHTLRWILVHLIEETARHNGHADILREMIDGSTGE
jgi:uncharacterized damage-inducible protein DinB